LPGGESLSEPLKGKGGDIRHSQLIRRSGIRNRINPLAANVTVIIVGSGEGT